MLADLAQTYGALHRYLYKPYEAGAFRKGADGRIKAIIKGAAGEMNDSSMTTVQACPRGAPELPSTADDRHQQHPRNFMQTRASNPRATHENRLVMRRSTDLGTIWGP